MLGLPTHWLATSTFEAAAGVLNEHREVTGSTNASEEGTADKMQLLWTHVNAEQLRELELTKLSTPDDADLESSALLTTYTRKRSTLTAT